MRSEYIIAGIAALTLVLGCTVAVTTMEVWNFLYILLLRSFLYILLLHNSVPPMLTSGTFLSQRHDQLSEQRIWPAEKRPGKF